MIFAEATAMQLPKVAKIGIKSTLAEINSENSPLLNSVVGGLLGGNISVSAVGWSGLLGTEIGLLDFLKQLAINLKLDAGDFNKLLDTRVSVGQVITALVDVMEKKGPAANIAVGALKDILALGVKLDKLQLNISELLNIQAGMSSSALQTNVNLFELVQSTIQVGNGNSAVAGQVDIPIPGLVNATIRIKAIEKPQFSAIGDPDLAKISPTGVNKIYVRTAQIRALLSIKLPVADALVNFLNLLADILQVIALDIDLLPRPIRLDVGIDAGGGRAYVTDYRCDAGGKKLTLNAKSSMARIFVGNFGDTLEIASGKFFSSTEDLDKLDPLKILDVRRAYPMPKYYLGGLDAKVSTEVFPTTSKNHEFPAVGLNDRLVWNTVSGEPQLIGSLRNTLKGIQINIKPADKEVTVIREVTVFINKVLQGILDAVGGALGYLISPIVDPLLDIVLHLLGVDISKLEVSTQLDCGYRAELVY